jgi:hypothetical protein
MPSLSFRVAYSKNQGLVLSPSEIIEGYLHGIQLCYQDGRSYPLSSVTRFIKSAQEAVENSFSIKLQKQIVEESRDFVRTEWVSWGFVKTTYPINEALRLSGNINRTEQMVYPKQWLSTKSSSDGPKAMFRQLYVIPSPDSAVQFTQQSIYYSNFIRGIGFFSSSYIPNYWKIKYCTGFDVIPHDLLDIIGKLTAIQVLAQLGDILLGVGLSSLSISLDGVSQSTSTTRSGSGGLFAGRIKQYAEELKEQVANARMFYCGLTLDVM